MLQKAQARVQADGNVVEHRQVQEEVVILKQSGDRPRIWGKIGDVGTVNENTPRLRRLETADEG